jgi:hypothetical protein
MKHYDYDHMILISDIHLGVHANSGQWLEYQIDYFEQFFFPLVEKFLKTHDPKRTCVFVLGDVYENRQIINIRVMFETRNIFKRLAAMLDVHILVGNHDIYYLNSNDISSVDSLEQLDNVTIWKQPDMIQCNTQNGPRDVFILPWVKDASDISAILNDVTADYVFAHCDVNSFKLNRYKTIDYGISVDSLSKFQHFYTGHIHIQQEKNNITMLGNPQQTERSDEGNDKGIFIFDVGNNSHEFIKNEISPKYICVNIEDLIVLNAVAIGKLCTNNFVDVEIDSDYLANNSVKINKLLTHIRTICLELTSIPIGKDDDDTSDSEVEASGIKKSFTQLVEQQIDKSAYSDNIKTRLKNDFIDAYNIVKSEQNYGNKID